MPWRSTRCCRQAGRATSSWPWPPATGTRRSPPRPGWSTRSTGRPRAPGWTRWRCSRPRSRRSGASGRHRRPAATIVDGRCSDMVAAPPATPDGHVWVAHTNDLSPISEASVVAIEWRVPGRAGGVLAGDRAVDQRGLELGGALPHRQRARAQRRAGGRPAAAHGPRAAHGADPGRGGGDGPAARPRLLVQHGLRAPRRAGRQRRGLRDGRRDHDAVGRRHPGPHQPLRLRADAPLRGRPGLRPALRGAAGEGAGAPRRAGGARDRLPGRSARSSWRRSSPITRPAPRSAATPTARRAARPRSGASPTSPRARSATDAGRAAAARRPATGSPEPAPRRVSCVDVARRPARPTAAIPGPRLWDLSPGRRPIRSPWRPFRPAREDLSPGSRLEPVRRTGFRRSCRPRGATPRHGPTTDRPVAPGSRQGSVTPRRIARDGRRRRLGVATR